MQDRAIIETQLAFYRRGDAGCLFAAHAAGDPAYFGWRLSVSGVEKTQIEEMIQSAIYLENVSTQSIIFPSVMSNVDLKKLLVLLKEVHFMSVEQEEEFSGTMCLGYRVKVGDLKSL